MAVRDLSRHHGRLGILGILGVLAILLLSAPSVVRGQGQSTLVLQGTTYLDVPSQTIGGPTVRAELRVDQVNVAAADLALQGQVSYKGQSYPLQVKATFHKSRLGTPSDKVAEASDATGNFNVTHLAVRQDPPAEALMVNDGAKGPTLLLYLQRIGSREFTFIEVPIQQQEFVSTLVPLLEQQLEVGDFTLDYWSLSILDPVSASSNPPGDVGIEAVQDTEDQYYSYTESLGNGCDVTYWIYFWAYSNGPSDILTTSADYNHELKVINKWTDSNCAFYRTDDSQFQLGNYGDEASVKIRAYGDGTSTGDVLLKGRFTGSYEQEVLSPVEITVSFTLGWKWAGLDFSATLCCPDDMTKDVELPFSHSDPDDWTKLTEYEYGHKVLRDENQRFLAVVQLSWGTGGRFEKTHEARWTVPIYENLGILGVFYSGTTLFPHTVLPYMSGQDASSAETQLRCPAGTSASGAPNVHREVLDV